MKLLRAPLPALFILLASGLSSGCTHPSPLATKPMAQSEPRQAALPRPEPSTSPAKAQSGSATDVVTFASQPHLAGAPGKSTVARYAEGDQAFKERSSPSRANEALRLFRRYHSENPGDPEAAWRHAMGCYFGGLHLAQSDDEKKTLFAEGRDAGIQAISLAPDCAPCHFWTAINMALYGQTVGAFKMFFTLGDIQEHLKKSAQIDPRYAGAGAYRLLGLIQQKLPGILGGSNDEARRFFQLAIETAPEEQLNYLVMMKLLAQQFDDIPGAREAARKGLAQPQPSADRIESVGSVKELEAFIQEHP